jgi:hypothetical protein
MVLNKWKLFLLLLILLVLDWYIPRIIWVSRSERAVGTVILVDRNSPVKHITLEFSRGGSFETVMLKESVPVNEGDTLAFRYQASDINDLKPESFWYLWGDVSTYCALMCFFLALIFLNRNIIRPEATFEFTFGKILVRNNRSVTGE